jgi:hypothetical protein
VNKRPAAVDQSSSCRLETQIVDRLSEIPGGVLELLTKKLTIAEIDVAVPIPCNGSRDQES